MRSRRFRPVLVLLLVLALVAAACGDDDDDEGGTEAGAGTEEGAGAGFSACQVTDIGGVDDRSFNQTAYAGLEQGQEELGVEIDVLESQAQPDFEPNINAFIEQGCDLIVTVGFLLGDATADAAEANPDQNFAIVDNDLFDAETEEDRNFDNVRELVFNTDEAAFLAGYLAAGMTQSGTIGTYGGLNIPTVTIFMDGFQAGMEHYNEENGADVQLVGWDSASQDGLFTGDFEDQTKGRQTTESLLNEGADIILPVAGPVGLGSVEAIRAGGGEANLIWVDTDGCVSVPDACDLFLTSVMKNMDVAVYDTVEAAVNEEFEGGLYTGTLENEGVGIAPYNELEDEVPQELKDQIDELRQMIIDGEITVGE